MISFRSAAGVGHAERCEESGRQWMEHTSRVKRFLFLFAWANVIFLCSSTHGRCDDGLWSSQATRLDFSEGTVDSPGVRHIVVTSPDGRKRLVVKDDEIRVEGTDVRPASGISVEVYPLAEAQWAPDSRAFFITQSDGGEVGGWDTVVYRVTPSGIKKILITSRVRVDFMKRYNCDVRGEHDGNEIPNIAAISWLRGSNDVLLIAEVPPHSSCPEMGKFMGYRVLIGSGKILGRYSAEEVKTRWGGFLGPRHGADEMYGTEKKRLRPWTTR
jgi:hypothetical protein